MPRIGCIRLLARISVLCAAGLSISLALTSNVSSLEKIRLVQPTSTTFRLPFYIAVQLNYFQDEGLDLQVVDTNAASNANLMLLGNSVDFTVGQLLDAINVNKQNFRSVGVAMLTSRLGNNIVVRKQLAGEVKSLRDLKGRPVGILSVGSGTWQFAILVAKRLGMRPEDFAFVSTGGGPNVFSAIKSGRVDAMSYGDPENLKLVLDGDAAFLVDPADPATHEQLVGKSYLNNQIMFMESYVKAHPQNVQAVVNAIQRALTWIHANKMEDVARVLVGYPGFAKSDPELLIATLNRMSAGVPRTAVITRDAFDSAMRLPIEIGVLGAPIAFETMVDNRFADAAAKKYPASSQ